MIAGTRGYYHGHRIRNARGERRLERRDIASGAQPAIVSRLIAGGGASMPSFGRRPSRSEWERMRRMPGDRQGTRRYAPAMQSPLDPSHADRAEPEQQVDAEPYQQEAARAAATSGRFCSAARSDFFEPQAEAIERAPQATEADRHPALGCQLITQFRERRVGLRAQARQHRLLMARELAGRARTHGIRAAVSPVLRRRMRDL
jgi:hypothetical protein